VRLYVSIIALICLVCAGIIFYLVLTTNAGLPPAVEKKLLPQQPASTTLPAAPTSVNPISSSDANGILYKSGRLGFQLRYPQGFTMAEYNFPPHTGQSGDGAMGVDSVNIDLSSIDALYPGQVSVNFEVWVNESTPQSCYTVGGNTELLSQVEINGINFHTNVANAADFQENATYATVHSNMCFEVTLAIVYVGTGDSSIFSNASKAQINSDFNQILNTFTFLSN
jgi:hypothetical protein